MNTEAGNTMLARRLRTACADRSKNIRLPKSIKFMKDGGLVRMHLDSSCVAVNMQNNASAFEGWALALQNWLPEVTQIELGWTFKGDALSPHYQRFLYRAKQFTAIFPSWFSIASESKQEFGKLRTDSAGPFSITAPKKERETRLADSCDSIIAAMQNEHKLECFIKDHPGELLDIFSITMLDRQYPVGVFAGPVKKGLEIFPRGHSALDLWGANKTDFFLFELKAEGNIPIGILSELFFYSYIMEGIQQRLFALQVPDERVFSTNTIRAVSAYILAPKWHPLISLKLLKTINTAFQENGRRIRFGAIRIAPAEREVFKMELPACD